MTCVLTERETRICEWGSENDRDSIGKFASKRDIEKVVFAACVEGKDDVVRNVLNLVESKYDIDQMLYLDKGPSLFGEEKHYTEGFVTPLFAAVMGLLVMREDDGNPKIKGCVKELLEHGANPYISCTVTENYFPVEITELRLDVRGLLRLCRLFMVGSTLAAAEVEVALDTFELKLGIQDMI